MDVKNCKSENGCKNVNVGEKAFQKMVVKNF